MSLTLQQADDEMFAIIKAVATGLISEVKWPDLPNQDPPTNNTTSWMRVSQQYTSGRQATLANHDSKRRYEIRGFLVIQVFTPFGGGSVLSNHIVNLLMNAFRNAQGSVWYRNPRPQHIGKSGAFYQKNFLVNFEYDEVQ